MTKRFGQARSAAGPSAPHCRMLSQALMLAGVMLLVSACSTRALEAPQTASSLTAIEPATTLQAATATAPVAAQMTATHAPTEIPMHTAVPATPARLDLSIAQTVTVDMAGSPVELAWPDLYGLVMVMGRDDTWVQTTDGQRLELTDVLDLTWFEQRTFLAIASDGQSLVASGRRVDQELGFQFHLNDVADEVRVADSLSPCGYLGWVKPDVLVCGDYLDSTRNTVTLKRFFDPHDGVLHSIPEVVAYNGIFAISPDRTQMLILTLETSGMMLVDIRTGETTRVLPWVKPMEVQLSDDMAVEWNEAGVTLATTQSNGITVVGPLRPEAYQDADPPRRIISFPETAAEWTSASLFWHDDGLTHIGVLRAAPNDTSGDDQPWLTIEHWLVDTESGKGIAYSMPESVVIGTVRASPDDRYWAWEAQDSRAHWVLLLDRETGRMARFDDGTDVKGWWVLPR